MIDQIRHFMPFILIGIGIIAGNAFGRGRGPAEKVWDALDAADKSGEVISSQELQRRSGVRISSFYTAIDRLMAAGWVKYDDEQKAEDGSVMHRYVIIRRPNNWPRKHKN